MRVFLLTYLDLKMVALQNSNIPGSVMRGPLYTMSVFAQFCLMINLTFFQNVPFLMQDIEVL